MFSIFPWHPLSLFFIYFQQCASYSLLVWFLGLYVFCKVLTYFLIYFFEEINDMSQEKFWMLTELEQNDPK